VNVILQTLDSWVIGSCCSDFDGWSATVGVRYRIL